VKLSLIRRKFSDHSIISDLFVNNIRECFALENRERAVAEGCYPILITWSNRFKRFLPLLMSVKGRTGIRIHAANWPQELEGCIAPGMIEGDDFIGNSVLALGGILAKMQRAIAEHEEITIEVTHDPKHDSATPSVPDFPPTG
jgi:hypothetical protein